MTQAQLAAVGKLLLAAKHLAVEHVEVLTAADVDFAKSEGLRKLFAALREVEGKPYTPLPGGLRTAEIVAAIKAAAGVKP